MSNCLGFNSEKQCWEYEINGIRAQVKNIGGGCNKKYADKTINYELELCSKLDSDTIKTWLNETYNTGTEWYSDKIERFNQVTSTVYRYTLRKPSTE